MSANARIAAFAVVLSVFSLCGYAPPASSQDRNEGNSDDQGFKGVVAPARSYDIAPPFDGQVIEIHFKPGEYVEKGKLLFTLDTTKEELELERDKAQLLRAEAQLRIAEVTLKKNEKLRKKNVVSEQHCLELEAQRDIAAAAAAEARIQVRGDEIKITGDEAIRAVCRRHEPTNGCRRCPSQRADDHGHDLRARSNLGQGLRALSSLR